MPRAQSSPRDGRGLVRFAIPIPRLVRQRRNTGRNYWTRGPNEDRRRTSTGPNKKKPSRCWAPAGLLVGEEGVEPSRPFGHTDLNRARLPFRHSPVAYVDNSTSPDLGARTRGHREGSPPGPGARIPEIPPEISRPQVCCAPARCPVEEVLVELAKHSVAPRMGDFRRGRRQLGTGRCLGPLAQIGWGPESYVWRGLPWASCSASSADSKASLATASHGFSGGRSFPRRSRSRCSGKRSCRCASSRAGVCSPATTTWWN